MKNLFAIIITIALLVALSACASSDAPETPETTEAAITEQIETTAAPTEAFNIDEYKLAVKECRDNIMENFLYLYNAGNYEVNYLKNLGHASDSTPEKAFEWLSKNSEADREYVDSLHATIREQYAALLLWDIEGKEASEIDENIRSMYDGYSSLYDCVTSTAYTASTLTSKINDAIDVVNSADDYLSLFIG